MKMTGLHYEFQKSQVVNVVEANWIRAHLVPQLTNNVIVVLTYCSSPWIFNISLGECLLYD